jgi:hypothetical protein
MNKIQRLFKKKIKGESLENLAKIFDVNLNQDFRAYDGWSATDIYAKLNSVPQTDSLKLEAYFHSKQFHSEPYQYTEYRKGICFNKVIEVPYEKLIGEKK